MANEPKVNLAFVETLPNNPVKGTVYMSPDSAEGFLKVGVGDNETETIFDSSVYAKKSDSVWVRGEGPGSAVLIGMDSSHARGQAAISHGEDTWATEDFSHAEGSSTTASGYASHAEGYSTKASGDYSHAEGGNTTASRLASHAEGMQTKASGQASHAEGYGSSDVLSFTISGDANTTIYTTNVAHGLTAYDVLEYNGIIALVTAVGTTKKFTVDHTLSDIQLTDASGIRRISGISYGQFSHAEGYSTKASGDYSHAEGYSTKASGQASHAEGNSTKASGLYSHAEGNNTNATGIYSHAEGYKTTASSQYSHAEGYQTTASGLHSHAEGGNTTKASGTCSHAEGLATKASGNYSHAEGYATTASGIHSHAEGFSTTASGDYSHAEGNNTKASGIHSHAEGFSTTASGQYSHAEGKDSSASGDHSHSEGNQTIASGGYSHAEGYGTTATNGYEHAQGLMNISHSNTIFSIGNGYHDDDSNQDIRSNALEIMQNGNAYLYGVASFNGQTIGNNKTLQYFLNVNSISSSEYDYIFGISSSVSTSPLSSHLIIDTITDDILPDIEGLYGSLSDYIDEIVNDTNNGDLYPGGSGAGGGGEPGPSNRWEWTGDTMSIDGNDYYVWNCICGSQTPIYGLMPADMTLETCINNSMCSDISNRWSPFEYIIMGDTIQDYDNLPVRYTLIYVKEYEYDTRTIGDFDLLDATLYLDTFDDNTFGNIGNIYSNAGVVNIGEYIDYYCENNLNDSDSTECTYQEDITFDGETYHMWHCANEDGGFEFYGLMPLSVTAEEVANNSKYVNPFNLYCPFMYELNNDEEVYSDDPAYLKTKRCLVTVVPGE
jgi:hypothetical protein